MIKAPQKRPRAYETVETVDSGEGFAVRLDHRPLLTPAGHEVVAPTRALAEQVAREWRHQGATPDFAKMPLTRLAFTAIDRGEDSRRGLVEEVMRYAANDLICYVAEGPGSLVEQQAAEWGPWRDWARARLELDLPVFSGVMPGDPGEATADRVGRLASELETFELIGLVTACGLLGSAILAFALSRGELPGAQAHALARLDEAWQETQWGRDAEAAARAQARSEEALALQHWFELLRDDAIPAAGRLCKPRPGARRGARGHA